MLLNVSNPKPGQVNGEDLPTTEEFTYLGSTGSHDGGAWSDIKNRLNNARNALRMLNNVWKSFQYSTKIKLKVYKSCVMSTLLYGTEYLRMTKSEHQDVSLPHKEPRGNPANVLAWHPLPPTASRPLQSRKRGDHHHAKAMEMDWVRQEERAGQYHSHSPSLDTWRKAEEGRTKKHLVPICGGRAQDHATHEGLYPEDGPELSDVAILGSRPTCHRA